MLSTDKGNNFKYYDLGKTVKAVKKPVLKFQRTKRMIKTHRVMKLQMILESALILEIKVHKNALEYVN